MFDSNPRDKIVKYHPHKTDYFKIVINDSILPSTYDNSKKPPLTHLHKGKVYYLKEYAPGTTHLVYVESVSMLNFPPMNRGKKKHEDNIFSRS